MAIMPPDPNFHAVLDWLNAITAIVQFTGSAGVVLSCFGIRKAEPKPTEPEPTVPVPEPIEEHDASDPAGPS